MKTRFRSGPIWPWKYNTFVNLSKYLRKGKNFKSTQPNKIVVLICWLIIIVAIIIAFLKIVFKAF